MKITILNVTTARPSRGSRPAVYFNLDRESVLTQLFDRRSRPYNEFKKVLDQALQMAGLTIKATDMGWSQYAGCTCPCSPGFVAKKAPLTHNVYVTYKIEEGETPDAPKAYSSDRLKWSTMGYDSYPEGRDYDRARNLKSLTDAAKMAKLITDPAKIVRRLKAVMKESPYEYRKPFLDKMKQMGYKEEDIVKVLGVKKSVSVMLPA